MGAGSSTEQRSPEQPQAGSHTPPEPEPEPSGDSPVAEAAPATAGDPAIAAADPATKLLQKNGQLSTINGLAEQGDLSLQEEALNGQEEEVLVTDVGQRESEDVRGKDADKEMAADSAVVEDIAKDGQEEMPEIIEQIPSSESNLEEITQPAESQANDVGFKKVFKFVGFKFTVKKDKTEKSDTVQLLTVKKDGGEGAEGSDGAGDHQEPSVETGEPASKESERKQSIGKPEDSVKHEQSNTEISLQAESGPAPEEEGKDEGEEKRERDPAKSPESPTSPITSETASPFKKFFTQGWAGWRKKTSFRKPKEEELEASEKKKEQDAEEKEKTATAEHPTAWGQPSPQEPTEGADQARLSADYEKVELPVEDPVSGLQEPSAEKCAPLATEIFDEKVEVLQEVVAEVHVSTGERKPDEQEADVEELVESSPPEKPVETNAEPREAEPAAELVTIKDVCVSGGDHPQPADPSPEDKGSKPHEGIVSEVELLSSQERIKVQGSPLKKLFTSTSLKKLSGKKQKGKRGGGGGGDEEPGEHNQVGTESPDSADEQKGESSASSPEEPEEITCLEKGIAEGHQEGEVEEGATSDGEKKREGITPWESFKKMVTPKKRVRRPSESDKEDELEKVKSATLSSTESAASEMQEESKVAGEEPKPEEPKRKVDTSVSWEALICVGSSKKRARKASSSDDEVGPKTVAGDGHRAEEGSKDKETGPEAVLASSQEHDQGQGSSSPEPAGSPAEGEGVSTWESFKRLVTPRKKSKSKLEERVEDPGLEHSASDVEPGREESWVSIKKFIPGRRKKRSDGKQEQATVEDTGPTDGHEDDGDVPAVVPLSEYDAVEREKMEAQQAQQRAEEPEQQAALDVSEELSKSLVHTVTVAVIDGTRAVTSVEERSPSWISASVTEPLEQAAEEAMSLTKEVTEGDMVAQETPAATQTLPESADARDDTLASGVGLTPEAVTAAEATEALCAEEATEASGAEETTEMVSAVSQLTDSPDTTEEATPVQEVEGGVPDVDGQERRTQAVLQAVAEKVREELELPDISGPEAGVQTVQRVEPRALEKVEEAEEDSEAIGLEEESDVVLEVQVQETKAEDFTRGSEIVLTTPASLEEVAEVSASIEPKELVTTCHAETLAGIKPREIIMEPAIPPDSAEALTDSDTNGSTPVADVEALDKMQQDEVMEGHEDNVVALGVQSQVTEAEAAPGQKEEPPAPPSFQPQEENREQSRAEDILDQTEQEIPVKALSVLSKTEVAQEGGQLADEEAKNAACVEGLEVSAHTGRTDSLEKVTAVALDGEDTKGAECLKNDNIELQRPSPEEREMVGDVGREDTEVKPVQVSEEPGQKPAAPVCEGLSQQLIHTVDAPDSDGGEEVSGLEGSSTPCPDQEEAGCVEVQVQSSDASVTPKAAAVEEKVLGETVKISETGQTLESAGARLITAEKSSEKDEDGTSQPGDDAVPMGPESQAELTPIIVAAIPEKGLDSDLEGERSTSQKQRSGEESEQVGCEEGEVSAARDGDLQAESEIVEFEMTSSKLVQNIIQTAVDQFARAEETAPSHSQTQAALMQAHGQGAGQKPGEEESRREASAQDETQTVAAQEESELNAVGATLSGVPKDVSEASEQMTVEAEGPSVNDQQFEEEILPSEAEGDATGPEHVLDDRRTELGERAEKPLSESKEDEKGDVTADPENQKSALADTDALGGLTKESPDTNGPKLTEEEDAQEDFEEAKVEIKPQTEEIQKQEREPAKSELTEPQDTV